MRKGDDVELKPLYRPAPVQSSKQRVIPGIYEQHPYFTIQSFREQHMGIVWSFWRNWIWVSVCMPVFEIDFEWSPPDHGSLLICF
jgi:hypothetical protein